jgi:L-asparaginase II
MNSEILAQVVRGDTVESVHRGHLVVMDGTKNVISSLGDPGTVTFFRSACKALQAMPFIASGGAERFGFGEDEIALACASHSGEPMHVKVAASMLEKAGFSETDLRCGTHLPFNENEAERMLRIGEVPTQLHNNCSGKHAAMLAFAKFLDADIRTYESIDNPIQQEILKTVAAFAEMPVDEICLGIDGCAAPNFAMPLTAMARCFANLINPPDSFNDNTRRACSQIVAAMTAYPELIGGTERLDTVLMRAVPGCLISKVGAEGIWLCGVLPCERHPSGLAIVSKIEDGDDKRARPVVAVNVLRRFGVLSDHQLTEFSPMPIKNRRGDVVGRVVSTAGFKMTSNGPLS